MFSTRTPRSSPLQRIGGMMSRRQENRVVAGVAGGIADRLGVVDLYVRAGFLVLALIWGVGAIVYLVLWAVTLDRTHHSPPAPRLGEQRKVGYFLMFAGGLLILRAIGVWSTDQLVWPGAAVILGVAFLMDRGDIDPRSAILAFFDPKSGRVRSRAVMGILLLVVGLSILGAAAVPAVETVILAVVVTTVGMAVLFGPWVWRLVTDLGAERGKRIREEERANMAAHLHDSVLQTLALIQRTDDPKRVVTLARVQERELRRWLYDSAPADGQEVLSGVLQKEADRIENTFDVPVELVTVGDRPVDDQVRAMVAAAGEALTNAARHSGADQISIYSEVAEDSTDVWVADLGRGFDTSRVASDRRGISESIVGRMQNHGGTAVVASVPGEGTEVHLQLIGEPQ
ncbi:MAG: PspC domain-containing protein [Acidimicrobiia bacterium]|nr:PspC domain-containing protein [Acidimicrobiia bacterium]